MRCVPWVRCATDGTLLSYVARPSPTTHATIIARCPGRRGFSRQHVSPCNRSAEVPRWEAGPHAGEVAYPNVDLMVEFTNALEAARSYEANLGAMDITKNMEQQTLKILA